MGFSQEEIEQARQWADDLSESWRLNEYALWCSSCEHGEHQHEMHLNVAQPTTGPCCMRGCGCMAFVRRSLVTPER